MDMSNQLRDTLLAHQGDLAQRFDGKLPTHKEYGDTPRSVPLSLLQTAVHQNPPRKTGIGQFGSQSPWASVLVSAAIRNDIKDLPRPDGSAQNRNGTVRTTAIARSFRAKYKPVDAYRRPVL